jgi:hypothetical protein
MVRDSCRQRENLDDIHVIEAIEFRIVRALSRISEFGK